VNTRRIMQKFLLQGSVGVVRYIIVSSSRVCDVHIRGIKTRNMSNKFIESLTLYCPRL
jgi:hypothetical protein